MRVVVPLASSRMQELPSPATNDCLVNNLSLFLCQNKARSSRHRRRHKTGRRVSLTRLVPLRSTRRSARHP